MKTRILVLAAVAIFAITCLASNTVPTPVNKDPVWEPPMLTPVIEADSIDVLIEYYSKMAKQYGDYSKSYPFESNAQTYFRGKAELCRQILADLKATKLDVLYVELPTAVPVQN